MSAICQRFVRTCFAIACVGAVTAEAARAQSVPSIPPPRLEPEATDSEPAADPIPDAADPVAPAAPPAPAETEPTAPALPSVEPTADTVPADTVPADAVPSDTAPTVVPTPAVASPTADLRATPEPYLLGPGDRLRITVFEEPEFTVGNNGEQIVSPDGTIHLPLVGTLYVENLSVPEVTEILLVRLSQLLKRPIVNVALVEARALRISVIGEVERPGSYAVTTDRTGSVVQGQTLGTRTLSTPTVTEAIQIAGGITEAAAVRQVQVIRAQGTPRERVFDLDLWALLQVGDTTQDIALRDGDTVIVPRAEVLTAEEVTELSEASFAPGEIRVQVVGEVEDPGAVQLRPNTPLNQAILAAGGFNQRRAKKSEVRLVRLNPDGTVTEREIAIDFESDLNDENNPLMRDNDVVIVGRSGLAATTDTVTTVLAPFAGILGFLNLIDGLGN